MLSITPFLARKGDRGMVETPVGPGSRPGQRRFWCKAGDTPRPPPDGPATLAACTKLRSENTVGPETSVVLMNTGSGLKYLELV